MARSVSKQQVKFILTTKTNLAEKQINEFLESLEPMMVMRIEPIAVFSGPSFLVGAMIQYWVEEEDNDAICDTESISG